MKANFVRKAAPEEFGDMREFVIEKTITVSKDEFEDIKDNPFKSYDFIKENLDLMCCDRFGVYHCIFVTSDDVEDGILIESEGYDYQRYRAIIKKTVLDRNIHKELEVILDLRDSLIDIYPETENTEKYLIANELLTKLEKIIRNE